MNIKHEDTLSVVVAVYNTEQYLRKCLTSIVEQSYQVDELILVDDGSTDSSGKICDEFLEKYDYIKVIHQQNKGQTAAQKAGMKQAGGYYISFIDSDDWVERDYFEILMSKMLSVRADAVITDSFLLDYEKSSKIWETSLHPGLYSKEQIKEAIVPSFVHNEIAAKDTILPFIPGKIFMKDMLLEMSLSIDDKIKLGQDGATVFPYILKCSLIAVVTCLGYHYVQREGSVSQAPKYNYFEELKCLQNYLSKSCKADNLEGESQVNIYIRDLLIIAVRGIYNLEMGRILCVPPYEMIDKGGRLVIYGAGNAGKSFVKQILHSEYAAVTGWIDQNCRDKVYGIQVKEPQAVRTMNYDQILIAITEEHLAQTVRDNLIKMDVPDDKIIWKPIYWG
ncbi:MAG: glycosyltransferase [Lachnospiraceae bacterium]|nr:glycosyltransferase [Lachnospiraceae bacterium]